MASPRGQNQEGSQREEENRSQEEERNFCGDVGNGGGSSQEDPGGLRLRSRGPGRELLTRQGGEAARVTTPRREGRCRRGDARPIRLRVAQRPCSVNRFPVFRLPEAPSLWLQKGLTVSFPRHCPGLRAGGVWKPRGRRPPRSSHHSRASYSVFSVAGAWGAANSRLGRLLWGRGNRRYSGSVFPQPPRHPCSNLWGNRKQLLSAAPTW